MPTPTTHFRYHEETVHNAKPDDLICHDGNVYKVFNTTSRTYTIKGKCKDCDLRHMIRFDCGGDIIEFGCYNVLCCANHDCYPTEQLFVKQVASQFPKPVRIEDNPFYNKE